jgi:hypothetical protein
VIAVLASTALLLVLAGLALGVWGWSSHLAADEANHAVQQAQEQIWALQRAGTAVAGCEQRGGVVSRRPFGGQYCKIVFADAGRRCTDAADCLGGCVLPAGKSAGAEVAARTGVCKAANVQGGCTDYLIRGKVAYQECVD